jgi:ATP-binding cassette subfamily B protein
MPLLPVHLGEIKTLQFKNVAFQHRSSSHKAIDGISF